MNRRSLFATSALVALSGCSLFTIPISPTLLQDGQLVVAGLQTLAAVVTPLNASAGAIVAMAATALQTAVTALQQNSGTPQSFATLVNDEITSVATPLLADFKANASVTEGVAALQAMIAVIGADVAAMSAPTLSVVGATYNPRIQLRAWIAERK